MARLPRLVVAGQPHHVIQRSVNGLPLFQAVPDYERMLELLSATTNSADVAVHAYVLMPSHFHLLVTPTTAASMSNLMQGVGRGYVRYYNDRYARKGGLFEGRYKATAIDSERYLFTCMAYIELNPVRAGLAEAPGQYPWSSYGHNIGHRADPLVREHPLFWALGNTPFAREAAYREIVETGIRQEDQLAITSATLKGWVLGADAAVFDAQNLARRATPLPRGRPRKIVSDPN